MARKYAELRSKMSKKRQDRIDARITELLREVKKSLQCIFCGGVVDHKPNCPVISE